MLSTDEYGIYTKDQINPFDRSEIVNVNLVDRIKSSKSYKDLLSFETPLRKHLIKSACVFIPLGLVIAGFLTYLRIWHFGSMLGVDDMSISDRWLITAAYFYGIGLIVALLMVAVIPNKNINYNRRYEIIAQLVDENRDVFKAYFSDLIFKKAEFDGVDMYFNKSGYAVESFVINTNDSLNENLIMGDDIKLKGDYVVDNIPVQMTLRLQFDSTSKNLTLTPIRRIPPPL